MVPYRVCLLLALAVCFVAQPASAQLIGGRSVEASGCASVAVGGNSRDTTITTVCGMPHEQVVELVRLAASPLAGDRAELMARVSALTPASSQLRVEAIAKFFQLLGEVPAEESRLADRFAQIADEHRRLLEEARSYRVNDPEVQALRQQAVAALEVADHTTASARLKAARLIVSRKRETLAQVLNDQKREEAALVFEQGRVESARLAYQQAAQLFAEAAQLLPAEDFETRWRYLMEEADAEQTLGHERGDNLALVQSIATYQTALPLAPRTARPLDWANTQDQPGNALTILGQRESVKARLAEAVAAFHSALEERTRERVPLKWAATQNHLGNALFGLATREAGTSMLEEAIDAYNEALTRFTRELAPEDWAIVQNNLGRAFELSAEINNHTTWLSEKAVNFFRNALVETNRELQPLRWAMIQNNLGVALLTLGARQKSGQRLEEAEEAFRDALRERTRNRVPLQWAQTKNNLGNVLYLLGAERFGTHENNAARLEAAVVAYREALQENTRERVPLDWANTQANLGNALGAIGAADDNTQLLELACTRFG